MQMVKEQVEKIMDKNNLDHPVTRITVLEICKKMNLRVTQMQAIEAILHCRGPMMEKSSIEDYNFDKLVLFLQQKIKVMPPIDITKPQHSLGLRQIHTTSTNRRGIPSVRLRQISPAETNYCESSLGRRDPRSFVVAERAVSRGRQFRSIVSGGSTDLPQIQTKAKLRRELD